MVRYTCDICEAPLGAGDGSVHHVDRYQLQLDLCAKHLQAWVSHAAHLLTGADQELVVPTNHGLSRAFMDALVSEGSLKGPLNAALPAGQPPQQDFNAGLKLLHETVDAFMAREKAAL